MRILIDFLMQLKSLFKIQSLSLDALITFIDFLMPLNSAKIQLLISDILITFY